MREQIACTGCSSNGKGCCIVGKPLTDGFCGKQLEKADQILALIKQANYVRLADDQSLPDNPHDYASECRESTSYSEGQYDMLKKGYKKVEL